MKFSIFSTGFILAASTASALHVPRAVDDFPLSKAEFTRLYDIVQDLVDSGDLVGVSALNFISGNALAPEGVSKRQAIRNPDQNFDHFRDFFP